MTCSDTMGITYLKYNDYTKQQMKVGSILLSSMQTCRFLRERLIWTSSRGHNASKLQSAQIHVRAYPNTCILIFSFWTSLEFRKKGVKTGELSENVFRHELP